MSDVSSRRCNIPAKPILGGGGGMLYNQSKKQIWQPKSCHGYNAYAAFPDSLQFLIFPTISLQSGGSVGDVIRACISHMGEQSWCR